MTNRINIDLAQGPIVGRTDDAHDLSELVVVVSPSEERISKNHFGHAIGQESEAQRKGGREKMNGEADEKVHHVSDCSSYTLHGCFGLRCQRGENTHMQPALQISMLVLYVREPSSTSGARYHKVTTWHKESRA